jgi:hypothetical protein
VFRDFKVIKGYRELLVLLDHRVYKDYKVFKG